MKIRINFYSLIFSILAALFVSFCCNGLFMLLPNGYRFAIAVAIIGILFLMMVGSTDKTIISEFLNGKESKYIVVAIFLFSTLLLLGCYKNYLSIEVVKKFFYCFVILLISDYLKDRPDLRKTTVSLIVLDVLICVGVNIYYSIVSPTSIRLAWNENGVYNYNGLMRVLSNTHMYTSLALSIALLCFINAIDRGHRWKAALISISSVYLAVVGGFSMPILLYGLTIILMLFKNKRNIIVPCIVIFGMITLLYFNSNAVVEFLNSTNIFGDDVSNRLQQLVNEFASGKSLNDYTSLYAGNSTLNRLYDYNLSAQAFFSNFFFGATSWSTGTPGMHSTWIDLVGCYGIFFSFPILGYFYQISFKRIKANELQNDDNTASAYRVISYVLLFAGIVNAISLMVVSVILLIIIPSAHEIFISNNE